MDLLLVAPCFPPQHAVASLRTHAFAASWARAGHRVTVLTTAKRADQGGLDLPCDGFRVAELAYPVPWFLERLRGRHKDDQAAAAAPRRWFQVLKRLRDRAGIFCSVRMPDLTDYWVRPAVAWAAAQGVRWDAVVSSSGPPAAHLVARALRQAGHARRWAADFRDLWTDHHLYRGLFPFTLRERAEERACLRVADQLVTVTEGLAETLAARAGRPVEVIYNGHDPDTHTALPPAPYFPADGRTRLVYTGTLYPQGQDPAPLLRALRLLPAETARRLTLVVAGRSGAEWRAQAARHGVAAAVEDDGLLPRADALRMQRDATALVLIDWRDPRQGVLTGKVFEYLQAPGPILVVGGPPDSEVARLVERAGRGSAVGTDPGAIARALADLVHRPGALARSPRRAFLDTLSRTRQSLRFLDLLTSVAVPRHEAA